MPLRTTADDPPHMNMIPMIDIMFNLVIFLMVGTEFATSERNIALRVPEVVDQKTALTTPPERQVVNVFRTGKITLNDEECSLDELFHKLEAKRSQYQALGVLVRGDREVAFQAVADVLNACKQAGIQEIGITVQRVSPPEK
jgi:biopolymer transport protein ExbD